MTENSEPKKAKVDHGPGGCHSFQKKKKRFCKMAVKPGEKYCGAHRDEAGESDAIRCQLCNDLIAPTKMASHLKRCNKVKEARNKPKYYLESVNNENYQHDHIISKLKLAEFNEDEVLKVIGYLNTVRDSINETIDEVQFDGMKELVSSLEEQNASKALREARQQSYILRKMNDFELLLENHCYIELGAGKGGLTERIAYSVSNCKFVIIDRATSRVKKERTLKSDFERVKIDIADFDIKSVDSRVPIVGIAKHLCGSATDLSIRGIRRADNLSGLAIVTCCHHRCTWSTFHSRKFLPEWCQVERNFRIVTLLSSWATCGFERANESQGLEFLTKKDGIIYKTLSLVMLQKF